MDALAQNARDTQAVQDQLGNMARDAYQQGAVTGLSIALEAHSPEDFTNRIVLMDTVIRVRAATLRGLNTIQAEGNAVRAHLVAVRQQVAALKVQAEAALAQATAARNLAAATKTKLDLLAAAQTRYTATVAGEITRIKSVQHSRTLLAQVLAARAKAAREAARERTAREAAARAAHQPVPQSSPQGSSSGFLSYPVNAPESSPFGMRFDPIMQAWRLHAGIDFAINCGTPVYAAADGDVIMTIPESASGGYGNRMVIDHGFLRGVDLTTTYNHLTSFVVAGGHMKVVNTDFPNSGAGPDLPARLGSRPAVTSTSRHVRTATRSTPVLGCDCASRRRTRTT